MNYNYNPNSMRQNPSFNQNFRSSNAGPYQQKQAQQNKSTSANSNQNSSDMLSSIDPIKLKIIQEIKEKSKHSSMEELLPEILKINQELNRRNMNFTKEETHILLDNIESTLSPSELQRFQVLKSFLI